MRSVMPSQVVAVIDRLFPHAEKESVMEKSPSQSTKVRGLLYLVEAIPAELLLKRDRTMRLSFSEKHVSETLALWQSRGAVGTMPPADGADAVVTLRRTLAVLPDEHPAAAHAELAFIPEDDLRESIRLDIGAAHRARFAFVS
jgi:hypothetical protein